MSSSADDTLSISRYSSSGSSDAEGRWRRQEGSSTHVLVREGWQLDINCTKARNSASDCASDGSRDLCAGGYGAYRPTKRYILAQRREERSRRLNRFDLCGENPLDPRGPSCAIRGAGSLWQFIFYSAYEMHRRYVVSLCSRAEILNVASVVVTVSTALSAIFSVLLR